MRNLWLKSILFQFVIFILAINNCFGGHPGLAFKSLTKDGAWCWFSDPRAVYYNGNIYSGWVSFSGDVVIGKYDSQTDELETTVLQAGFDKDDHANPALLMRDDGQLLVFYSRHNDTEMNIRITEQPGDISSWLPVIQPDFDKSKKGICYDNPVQLSEEKNKIFFFWRGIDFKPTYAISEDGGVTWSDDRRLIESPGARPYLKVASNDNDRIHFAFTTGHPRNEAQNSIYYMLYKNGSFFKADGSRIKDLAEVPIAVNEADVVYDAKSTSVYVSPALC